MTGVRGRNRLRLRFFTFFTLAGLITIMVYATLAYTTITDSTITTYRKQAERVLEQFETRLSAFLNMESETLTTYHSLIGSRDDLADSLKVLKENPRFIDAYVLSPQGIVAYATDPVIVGYNYRGRDIFLRMQELTDPFFHTQFHPLEQRLMLNIIVPVLSGDKMDYIAVHELSPLWLEEYLAQGLAGGEGEVIMFNTSGAIFSRIAEEELEELPTVRATLSLLEYGFTIARLTASDGELQSFVSGGYLVTYKAMRDGVGLVANRVSLAVLSSNLRRAYITMFGASLAGLVVFVVMGIALANRTIKPINDMSVRVRDVISGNQEMLSAEKNSELIPIVDAFNSAWQSTRSYHNQLLQEKQLAEEARDRAEEANKIKGQFMANISHEIRTPINGIVGLSYIAKDKTEDPQMKSLLGKIQESSALLLAVVNDILDFSKLETDDISVEAKPFYIRPAVQSVVDLLMYQALEKGITLDTHVSEGVPQVVVGDMVRVKQVLTNLLSNAVKFTEQGRVWLSLSVKECDDTESGLTLLFDVRDTGIGIPEDKHELLFRPFSQVDGSAARRHGGTGLGLSIARRLIDKMGGSIGFESVFGKGSRFYFELPTSVAEEPQTPQQDNEVAPIFSSIPEVLVVEDNIINQQIAQELLQQAGIRVSLAGNGLEALRMLEARQFNLILMDIQMPELDGYETTRRIRSMADPKLSQIPIIAMTAHAMQGDREISLMAGMTDYISKPIDPHQFLNVISCWLQWPNSTLSRPAEDPIVDTLKLEVLPGLNMEEALKRVGGNTELYLDVLKVFKAELSEAIDQVGTYWTTANMSDMKNVIHNLKGTAGNVGAMGVREAAVTIEQSMHTGTQLEEKLAVLREEVSTVRQTIDMLLKKYEQDALPSITTHQLKPGLVEVLQELLGQLEENYLISDSLLSRVRERLPPRFEHEYLLLRQGVESFDFPVAISITQELLEVSKSQEGTRLNEL